MNLAVPGVDSVVHELYTKVSSLSVILTAIYAHYSPDLHLMTSRELTSGFNFWSHGHLRMAVLHLFVKTGADIFFQSRVIDIFSEIQDGGRRHL